MSYPKSRLGKLHIKKADLLRELDAVLTAIEADLVTVLPTFSAVRLLNGSVATLEVTGKSTFHDGFQGIFDRQPVGTYVDDDTNVLVAGSFAYVRRVMAGTINVTNLDGILTNSTNNIVLPPGGQVVGSTLVLPDPTIISPVPSNVGYGPYADPFLRIALSAGRGAIDDGGGLCSQLGDFSMYGTNNATATGAQRGTLVTTDPNYLQPYLLCGQSVYSAYALPTSCLVPFTEGEAYFVIERDEGATGQGGLHYLGCANNALCPFTNFYLYETFGSDVRHDQIANIGTADYKRQPMCYLCVYSVHASAGFYEVRLNNQVLVRLQTNTVQFAADQGLFVGGTSNTVFFKGKFFDFLLFSRVSTDSKRDSIYEMFFAKHGISLGHPRPGHITIAGSGYYDDSDRLVTTAPQIYAKRTEMTRKIFGASTLPATLPTITANVVGPLTSLTNIARCDQLDLAMAGNKSGGGAITVNIRAHHYIPAANATGKAVIFCPGHQIVFDDSHALSPTNTGYGVWRSIQAFLSAGHNVILCPMVCMDPINAGTCEANWGAPGGSDPHPWLGSNVPDSAAGSYIRFHLGAPIAITAYLSSLGFTEIVAAGISGGGWTSILLQALDIRVKRSYSHFGPQPLYMRSAGNIGDIENFDGNIYGLCGYLDWSTMAAHRRRHIQIYGTGDSVFGPANFPTSNYGPRMKALTWRQTIDDFAAELKAVATSESGSFDVWYDTNATTHQTTWQTLAAIIGDM